MVVFLRSGEAFEERPCRGRVTAQLSATFRPEREDRVAARRMPAGSGRPLVAPEFAAIRKKAEVSSRGLNATGASTAAQLMAHQPLIHSEEWCVLA